MNPHGRMRYEPIPASTPAEVEAAIARGRPDELLYAVLSASLYSDELEWAQDVCLRLAAHPHFNVRGNALLGFGHLARRFGRLDEARVRPLLEAGMRDADEYVRGQAHDAADDAEHFLGWKVER